MATAPLLMAAAGTALLSLLPPLPLLPQRLPPLLLLLAVATVLAAVM